MVCFMNKLACMNSHDTEKVFPPFLLFLFCGVMREIKIYFIVFWDLNIQRDFYNCWVQQQAQEFKSVPEARRFQSRHRQRTRILTEMSFDFFILSLQHLH